MGNYTSYPSAFLVVDPDGVYSKHYYAGAQRIAARVGVESADVLFPEDQANFCSQEGGRTAEEHKKLQQNDLQHYLEKGEIKTKLSFKENKPIVEKEEEETTSSSDMGESYAARPEDQIYYYHPDHLGTATFLTDGNGLPYEFFLNLPFGETMAEQHSQTADYDNRWKFTGHELDRETGLYYAGARYYDPKVSIWLSVDPLAEKYPNWNPYNYVMQNPINLIDPTGMCPDETENPKKNIFIVLDYDGGNPGDESRENIEFKNMEENNWHGIYAKNLQDASSQLSNYLGDNKADNILLKSHGGTTKSGESAFCSDNNSNGLIYSSDMKNYSDGNCSSLSQNTINDIDALVNIVNSINDGKNFIMGACSIASNDDFLGSLQLITGSKIDMFGSADLTSSYLTSHKTKKGTAIYDFNYYNNSNLISKENMNFGAKRYPVGYQDSSSVIQIQNIQINKNGVKAIK